MSTGSVLALACGVLVAYLNGANDVSKGIATLAGSGVTNYRRAILWGAVWTGAGGMASSVISQAMIGTFGAGLLANESAPTLTETLAVLLGVAACVGLATRLGLPVSTTHAIVGSVAGVYSFSFGVSGVNWGALGGKVALPLLASPALALGFTVVALQAWRLAGACFKKAPECLCVDLQAVPVPSGLVVTGSSLAFSPAAAKVQVSVDSQEACAKDHAGAFRITATKLHWLTSGATSLARGLNDTPKIVALGLFATALSTGIPAARSLAFAIVTVGMVAGSWVAGKRVTTVLAEKVTPMDHREGFMANLVTTALVGPGAALGLPMSTTHVSSCAIIGVGIPKRALVNWRTVQGMLLAWVVTVPLAAALGVVAYKLLSLLH
jgi:PiT family inorganic phosphate transporter